MLESFALKRCSLGLHWSSRKILVLFTEISHREWVRGDIELLQICVPRSDTLVQ